MIKINSDIDLRWNFFRVKDNVSPDITIRIARDISLNTENLKRICLNYFGLENGNFVYHKIHTFPLKSKVMLKDIFGKTLLAMTKGYYMSHLAFDILPLITHILRIKLLLKGATFLHSACISFKNSDEGVLLAAYPDTGKTLTTLLALKTGLFNYISDDIAIVNRNGCVWSLPRLVNFHSLEKAQFSQEKISIWKKMLSNLISKIPYPFSTYMPPIDSIDMHKIVTKWIKDKTIVRYILVLEEGRNSWKELTEEQIVKKLLLINQREFGSIPDLLNIYAYLSDNFDLESIFNIEKSIISHLAQVSKCFLIKARKSDAFIDVINKCVKEMKISHVGTHFHRTI